MQKLEFDFIDKDNMGLLTDFYELTMCASYLQSGRKDEVATFDLFIRKLPRNRSYFLFAGVEQVLLFIEKMRFNEEQIRYLGTQGLPEEFLRYLRSFRFTGEVWSVPEGTIVFPEEPLIRVTAPIIEAQLIESFVLNTVNLQTMIATKASRVVCAAKGRPVIEFGLRRTQGTDASMKAARTSYLAGAAGTSNVLAGMIYGIPIFGTMAHSYIMFFDSEIDSFRAFAKTFPANSTLLIDTYDDVKGAQSAAVVAKELEKKGYRLNAVRIDSGDLFSLSKKIRRILDRQGLEYVKIFASGDLDEYVMENLLKKGAKIDAFGVGTKMSTSYDRPYVDVVYKLSGKVEKGNFVPAMKLSKGKMTLPGKKQIFRKKNKEGKYAGDTIGLDDENVHGERLLIKVMENGHIACRIPTLEELRKNVMKNLSDLPEKYRKLNRAPKYPVRLSRRLTRILDSLTSQLRNSEGYQ